MRRQDAQQQPNMEIGYYKINRTTNRARGFCWFCPFAWFAFPLLDGKFAGEFNSGVGKDL
jgi:hypothetical protein